MHPLLQQCGFDADDRVVIIHPDDIGMCQATLEREIGVQLERALAAGIDVTHLDAHMDTLTSPPATGQPRARTAVPAAVPGSRACGSLSGR